MAPRILSLVPFLALISPGVPAFDCDGDGGNDALGFGIFHDCNSNDWPDACDLARSFMMPDAVFEAPDIDSVSTNDLDADGDIDLALTGSGEAVYVLLNNGSGLFTIFREYHLRVLVSGVVSLEDLEGDGDKDIFVSGNGLVQSLVNRGNATFFRGVEVSLGTRFTVGFGDLDGDKNLDIVAGDPSVDPVEVAALINDGAGGFREASVLGPKTLTRSLAVTDLNLDGRNDIALATEFKVVVLLNQGSVPFQMSGEYPVGSDPVSIHAGDIDGDGDPDLVTVNAPQDQEFHNNNISILSNSGAGTFELPRNISASLQPVSLQLRDLEGDHDLDAIGISTLDRTLTVLWNDETRSFNRRESWLVSGQPTSLDFANIDADGDLDVVTNSNTSKHDHIIVLPNLGQGKFQTARYEQMEGSVVALTTGDLDGDGDSDLAMADMLATTSRLVVYVNEGGGLRVKATYDAPSGAADLLAADLDSDHDLDLVINEFSEVVIYSNDGLGNFGLPVVLKTMASSRSPDAAAADINGDGLSDLVVTAEASIKVLYNRGGNLFDAPRDYSLGYTPWSVVAADFDRDGRVDLAVTGRKVQEAGKLSLYRNEGSGALSLSHVSVGNITRDVAAGDVDTDGNVDFVVLEFIDSAFFVLKGRGDGTFAEPVGYSTETHAEVFALRDIDADGDLDVVVPLFGEEEVLLFFNMGDGSFGRGLRRPSGDRSQDVVADDLDGDSDIDIAIASDNGLFVLENVMQAVNRDCNGNGVLDTCDMTIGLLTDLNDDGLADDCGSPLFRRGDVDADGDLSVTDAIKILLRLFSGGEALTCALSADTDDDAMIDLTDAILLLRFLFAMGEMPSAPFPNCGTDPRPDDLGCRTPNTCI